MPKQKRIAMYETVRIPKESIITIFDDMAIFTPKKKGDQRR